MVKLRDFYEIKLYLKWNIIIFCAYFEQFILSYELQHRVKVTQNASSD